MFEELYAPLPDIGQYLDRIGLNAAPPLTPEGLSALVFAHQKTVPFESLELCVEGGSISIGVERLFDKVVRRHRGGYCFELNGLFYSLQKALGFDANPLLARVMNPGNEHPVPLHRCTMTCFGDERYFSDVGFGGPMPAGALPIIEGVESSVRNGVYRFDRLDAHTWQLMRLEGGCFIPTVRFSDLPADQVDFVAPNFFCSDAPGSFFRMAKLANIYTEDGYCSLTNDELKISSGGEITVEKITDEAREREVLRTLFGIVL